MWSDKETGEQEPEPHSLGAIGELLAIATFAGWVSARIPVVGRLFLGRVAAPGSVELSNSVGEDGLIRIADSIAQLNWTIHNTCASISEWSLEGQPIV